ncbi:MAG: amino acid adenylation domain-containing protein [Clostridia bacterium]
MEKETLINTINRASANFGDKVAFSDTDESYSFATAVSSAESIATKLVTLGYFQQPVALYMPRCARIPLAMAGTLLSGNFYTVLDVDSPQERIAKIVNALSCNLIICPEEYLEHCVSAFPTCTILSFENICLTCPSKTLLASVAEKIKPDDIAFTIFTSGSTGTPKGTIITHKNVLSYVGWFVKRFDITSNDSFGSQTPFFFSMSVTDFFSAWVAGSSYHIIPKSYFAFPGRLISYLNDKKINIIYWVPTACDIVAKFDLLYFEKPKFLTKVFFAGEAMPVKVLNYWRKNYPNAMYTNLFGPTETTDICSYYVVDREFGEDEGLPIGLACEGANLFVIDENGKQITAVGEVGELYVGGDFVAKGYINEPEKTAAAFVQSPLQNDKKEILYRTGDLVAFNDRGELLYLGRRDSQIKYMGYRIELGEIENVMNAVDGIGRAVCLFDSKKEELILLYEGESSKSASIATSARTRLPAYMTPQRFVALDAFPVNANGKIDRALLKKTYLS